MLETEEVELNNQSLKEFLKFALKTGMCNDVNVNQMRLMKMMAREDSVPLSQVQLHRSADKLTNSEGSKSAILMVFLELFGNRFEDTGVLAFLDSEDFATLMRACPMEKMVEWVSRKTNERHQRSFVCAEEQKSEEAFSCENQILFNKHEPEVLDEVPGVGFELPGGMVLVQPGDVGVASSSYKGMERVV